MVNKKEYIVYAGVFVIFCTAFMMANAFPEQAANYPKVICTTGMVLVALLTIKNYLKELRVGKNLNELGALKDELQKHAMTWEQFKRICIFIGMLLAYIASINKIGYFASTAVYLIASMTAFKKKINWLIIVASLIFVVMMYVVFDRFLHIIIPHGMLY